MDGRIYCGRQFESSKSKLAVENKSSKLGFKSWINKWDSKEHGVLDFCVSIDFRSPPPHTHSTYTQMHTSWIYQRPDTSSGPFSLSSFSFLFCSWGKGTIENQGSQAAYESKTRIPK